MTALQYLESQQNLLYLKVVIYKASSHRKKIKIISTCPHILTLYLDNRGQELGVAGESG